MCVCVYHYTLDYARLRVIQAVKTLEVRSTFHERRVSRKRETQNGYRIIVICIYIYMYYVNISCIYTSIFRDFLARTFKGAWKAS